jgi:hypothetical protein
LGQRIDRAHAGNDALLLLDQALVLLDDANILVVAAHVDLARQTLAEILCDAPRISAQATPRAPDDKTSRGKYL